MVGRDSLKALQERIRGVMENRRGGGGYRNLGRSGQNPQHARAISASRSTTAWAAAIVVAMIAAVTVMFVPAPAAQANGTTVVDPDTSNQWSSIATSSTSTENIGRIWTDKSVYKADHQLDGALSGTRISKGDSDFLVGLSAMSSTSNVKSTVTRTDPLDIVLIIDRSSSMRDGIEQAGSYTEVSAGDVVESHGHSQDIPFGEIAVQDTTGGEYYALVGDQYVRIQEEVDRIEVGWTAYNEHIRWTLNGETVTPEDTQFYEYRSGGTISRMQALKTAANNFIDSAAALPNAEQVRIGIVSFAGSSAYDQNAASIDRQLTNLSGNNVESLKTTISNINPPSSGAGTYPANAFQDAQGMFNRSAQGTQKVVVFFTDGGPGGTTTSVLDNDVANSTIQAARAVKVSGATVYSVGVLDGADPTMDISNVVNNSNSTLRVNAYMHAVSSNYPTATGFTSNAIGNRAPNSDYYKAASNSEELNNIFSNIFEEIENNQGSGSPIEEEDNQGAGAEGGTPGNLVFEDRLGSYMEVTGDKMTLVYADGLHESTRTTIKGNVTTYHFEGQFAGNAEYGPANYGDITVTVTHSEDSATGDTVTATIPASLIPMRSYNVDTDSETPTMSITDAYPMRLYYGVSLKQEAKGALEAGSGDVYDAIVEGAASEGGTIDFYTNAFANNAPNGLTTATFTPNEANKFYYYTQDTTLYLDEDCIQVATSRNSQNVDTFYYSEPYWTRNADGTAVQHSEGIAIERSDRDFQSVTTNGQGQLYIPAHTARQDRPGTLNVGKSDNVTKTASQVLVPSWNNTNESVTQCLGNNGKMSYPMPGSLEIKKTVDWTNASNQTKQEKNSFTFDISLTDAENNPVSGTYNYYVDNAETASGQVTFTNGQASIKVDGGTTVRIDGLAAGAKFTVTEQSIGQNGFTLTSDATSQAEAGNTDTTDGIVGGTIVAGSQVLLSFDNQYHAENVNLSTEATLQVKKNLTNRDWRDTDEFTFVLDGLSNTAAGSIATPEPDETTVTIDDETVDYTTAFGNIIFTAPGEYSYSVVEDNDTDPIAGIDYSDAIYRVMVTVTDNGTGQLEVSDVKVEQTQNDAGSMSAQDEPVAIEGTTMTFTNNYNAGVGTTNINAVKNYTDTTGGNPNDRNKFTFQIEALGGYETEGGSSANYTVTAVDVPMPEGSTGTTKQVGNTGSQVNFGTITYDGNDTGKTFEYKVTESAGDEQGMIYDKTERIVQVKVDEVTDGTGTHIVATVLGDYADPSNLSFSNTYKPTEATLSGDTAIHGTKTLTGRDLNEGEKFYFTLTQTGGPATLNPDDDADVYTQVLTQPEIVSVDSLTDGSADFSFGKLTFTQVGTYIFTVDETAEDGSDTTDGNGLTYSKNVAKVTVEVKDNGEGALVPTVSYANSTGSTATDKAVFTNAYESSMDYGTGGVGGINVTKQLDGRPMAADEFTFTITGQGAAADMTTDLDREFKNKGAAEGTPITMNKLQSLSFDQDDAGKTYIFIVDETEGDLTKVTYDQSQYKVEIRVQDDGLGNMHAVTTVTRIKNADGTDASTVVVNSADSSADGYEAPTFGFVNTYTPDQAVVGEDTQNAIQVTKNVTGAPSPDGVSYGFTLALTSNNADGIAGGMTANDEGVLQTHVQTSGAIVADGSQTVSFGDISFSKPGTYTFDVTEDALAPDEGWSYDTVNTGAKTVTVVVRNTNDQGQFDGKLYIDDVIGSPVQVTNAYKPGEVVVGGDGATQQITVKKTVTGADSDTTFTFQIEPVITEGEEQKWTSVESVDLNEDGKVTISNLAQNTSQTATFGGVKFTEKGEYQFKITEVGATDFNKGDDRKGWTYDEHSVTVTVTVDDTDYDGQLEAKVSYDNSDATTDADKAETAVAAFTNKYEAGSATLTGDEDTFNGSKTVTGRDWLDGESFGFTMKPVEQEGVDWSSVTYKADDSSEPVAAGENTATATENGDKTVPFWFPGSYTFTKAGTYTFNVTETQHNSEALPQDGTNGMTYDHHTGVITVTVEDNGEGQLVATPKYEKMTFENKYTPTPVVYGDDASEILGGNKTVEDHSGSYTMADDQFTFMMRAQNADNPMPEGLQVARDDQGRPIVSVTNKNTDTQNNKATFDFGEITFTKAGTYQYNIYENETNMPAGVSAQDSGRTYTITFKVTENTATGELTVDASAVLIGSGDQENVLVQLNEINFVNEYDATAASGSTQIFKTLEGRNWQQGDTFTFDVSMTVDGVAADEMPTFNFDNTGATVNDFKSEAGKLSYNVTITPSTSATGNTYAFSTGTATYTHEGTYVYTITERDVDSSVVNVTKDAAVYTVTVEVKNVNNALQRTVTITRDGQPYTETGRVDFTNTYTPTASEGVPAHFALRKTFTGHEWTNDYAFEFKLSPVDNAPMPKEDQDAGVTIDDEGNAHKTIDAPTGDSKDTATFDFGAISYDKAGTYKYTVTEVKGDHGGVTYDTNTVDITVEVKDVAGQLVATATETGSFTNTYNTSADYNTSGTGGLDITKQVTNHAMADDQFSFTITATGDNADAAAEKLGIQDGVSTEVKSAAAAAGVAKSVKNNPFETVSFDKSDDGVTYTYTIKENGKTGEGGYKNYVLDTNTYTVEITPTDNGDGTMTVKTVVNDTETTDQRVPVAFVNSYKADPTTVGAKGAATIEGTKTLKNDDIANYTGENAFKFQVKSGDVVVAEGTNDADGNITFGDITYTTEKLAAAVNGGSDEVGTATAQTTDAGTVYTFNYTVSEVAPDQSTGVTANTGAQSITVTVTDDGNGKLTPKVTYGTGDSLAFVNTYGGEADYALDITGMKKIVGGQTEPTDVPTLKGGEYEFTITGNAAQDGTPAPMPAKTTVKNDAAGGVTFEDIHYTMENTFGSKPATANADAAADEGIETYTAGRTQVFTYTISESGSVDGVTNEQGTKTVTVMVTDLGGGQLKAEVTSDKTDEGTDFTFTNVYDVKPNTSSLTGDGGFTITKKLDATTGRKLAENEFTFQLKSGDTVVATATNAADGTVRFDGITFTKPGTYNYVLSEVNDGKPGVDYDATKYNVTATAEDQGDGTLKVTWEMPQAANDAVTFTNVYDPADATVTLGAGKTFAGADLKDAQFTFQLTGADESTPMPEGAKDGVSTATNDENGSIVFGTIAYDKPGTYKYTVSEVNDEQDGVTYDDTTYEVTVTVTDDTATGTLKAAVSYGDADAMVFSNQYKKPVEPAKPTIPKTGIDVIIPGVAGLVLLLGAGGVYAFKRRKRS